MSDIFQVKCFESSFGDCFNNPDTFPDIAFVLDSSNQNNPTRVYAHRLVLYKVRFLKNLFDVEDSREKLNSGQPMEIHIQEPEKIFIPLIQYFYSGVLKCEVNQLSELLMLVYRFRIVNLITLLKKALMGTIVSGHTLSGDGSLASSGSFLGDIANSSTTMVTTFDRASVMKLPENTKMTIENAVCLYGEVAGNATLENSVFKTEFNLAKRVILKSICFSLFFNQQVTTKMSVNALSSLIDFLTENLPLILSIQKVVNNSAISSISTKDLNKCILKWMMTNKAERLNTITQLYDALKRFATALTLQTDAPNSMTDVLDFIKNIDTMQETNRKLSDATRKRVTTENNTGLTSTTPTKNPLQIIHSSQLKQPPPEHDVAISPEGLSTIKKRNLSLFIKAKQH